MLRHAFITTYLLFFVFIFIFRTYIVGILNTYIILQGLGKKGSLMIDRYTQPAMGHIFSLENKYNVWKEIEVCACEAQAELGLIGITKTRQRGFVLMRLVIKKRLTLLKRR